MSTVNETSCPNCSERVPKNCVRCPECREFMRAEMAEFYRQQQLKARPVIYSDDSPPKGAVDPDDTATE